MLGDEANAGLGMRPMLGDEANVGLGMSPMLVWRWRLIIRS